MRACGDEQGSPRSDRRSRFPCYASIARIGAGIIANVSLITARPQSSPRSASDARDGWRAGGADDSRAGDRRAFGVGDSADRSLQRTGRKRQAGRVGFARRALLGVEWRARVRHPAVWLRGSRRPVSALSRRPALPWRRSARRAGAAPSGFLPAAAPVLRRLACRGPRRRPARAAPRLPVPTTCTWWRERSRARWWAASGVFAGVQHRDRRGRGGAVRGLRFCPGALESSAR